ncbi:MAG: hypothetical protein COB66_01325 [Coxiella sp. (in: Bacteria)]|nr:MAG: hypothetical protein COB66_01325 [Coxiella sp. (in: g-proteobacteria)]
MAEPKTFFNTAYAEALTRINSGDTSEDSRIPSYMVRANTLNVSNRNQTFEESAIDFVEGVPKFIGASVISGVSQLYNIAPSIGNLFGGDFEELDIGEVIADLDSDLGQFYKEHQEGIDLVGFIASSIVPGTAGVKLLNAGQRSLTAAIGTGKLGNGMARSFGLLAAPNKQKHLSAAISEVVNSNSAVSLTNGAALRAIGSGFTQNILEGAAFEVGVAATMFNSPILEAQDLGDLVANVAFGAGVFGLVGGVVSAVGINSALKKAATAADIEARPWADIITETTGFSSAASAASSYEKIALDFDHINKVAGRQVPMNLAPERRAFLTNLQESTIGKAELRIRKELGEVANGDQVVAGTLFEAFKRQSLETQQSAFIGMQEATRFAEAPKLEKLLGKLKRKISKGDATIDEIDEYANVARSYTKVWGESAGEVTTEIPVITSLVDTLKAGESIKVSAGGVKAGSKSYSFNSGYNLKVPGKGKADRSTAWSMLTSEPLEANARYLWAAKLPTFKPTVAKPIRIGADDIPLLEKAIADIPDSSMQFVKIVAEDGSLTSARAGSIRESIADTKALVANKLHKSTTEGLVGSDATVVANKLRSMLGIRFSVEDLTSGTIARLRTVVAGETKGFSKIEVSAKALTEQPLHKLVSTILHEEGHVKFNTILDIGGIPKSEFATVKKEIIAASKKARPGAWKNVQEGSEDFQYLNSNAELMADSFSFFTQYPGRMAVEAPTFEKLFGHLVRPLDKKLVESYSKRMNMLTQDEIASMVNVKSSWLGGEQVKDGVLKSADSDIFAMQDHAAQYTKKLVDQGSWKADAGLVDMSAVPQHMKLTYDTTPFKEINNNVIENMATIKGLQKQYQASGNIASKEVLGKWFDQLPDISSGKVAGDANRSGAGAGFASAASSNYGGLAATTEFIGSVTSRATRDFQAKTTEVLEPLLYKLANNQEAAVEWSVLSQRVRNLEEIYGLNAAGNALEPIKLIRWKQAVAEVEQANAAAAKAAIAAGKEVPTPALAPTRPVLSNPDTPLLLEIKNSEVSSLARAHIETNGARTSSLSTIRSAQGAVYQRDPGSFYPIPINPKDFPHFAMVTDSSVTATGHHTTLYATTAEDLERQISKLKTNPHLKIRTKKEAEDYFSSIGQWEYEKTLSDNYLDITAKRSGVSAPFLPATDPGKITADLLNWHMARDSGLVREAVTAKYEVQFQELKRLGDEYTNVATSKFSIDSLNRFADDSVKNPYNDYIKTALAVRKNSDYPFWVNVNTMADEAISKMYRKVSGAVESARTEDELLAVNGMLEQAGYKGAHYDAAMEVFANAGPAQGVLTKAIQKGNSVLATIVLRLDTLNSVNNAVSANVLLGAETKAVIRAISQGDEEAVGALAALTRIKVPGTDSTVFSPTKLIANSVRRFNAVGADMQFYKDIGVVTSISDQYKTALDALTYTGKDVKAWSSRIDGVQKNLANLANTGEKWTGNKLAEEFNRFVAADVMKQMTDVAVSRNLMSSKEQLAYINTFVNRTQGNYLASQRPMMFQGAIGQAIGLFQTYQFNLMQQLLRHVGEGHAKDTMTLLALQGTIHGMNGLPGFNAINTSLLGNASGNKEHRDAFDAVYGIAGKEAGDWLMYGMASNALGLIDPDLKINLYTRGDINPRHVTIVPTNPVDVPIYAASTKFFANLFTTAKKLAAGGDISTTLLQGIEHNGLSRPLAGLAQTLQGIANPVNASYSTSNRGNVIASNDLLSLANLGRMVGGKPLDEAIAIDAVYRYKAYGLADAKKRAVLGQAIKTTLIAGQNPTLEQIEGFAEGYAAAGGRSEEFNKWFTQLNRTTNLSQANKISQSLSSPFTQSMQRLMGGREFRDFTE